MNLLSHLWQNFQVNETSYIGQHQLGIFCNHSKPAPITTTGSHAIIHFHSDNSGTDQGFHLSFLSIAGNIFLMT